MIALPSILLGTPEPLGKHRRWFKRKAPLTVCIAAICNYGATIFGACDRMLTSGDIEFEPRKPNVKPAFGTNPKMFAATNSIAMMTAGDSGLQAEIMADTLEEIKGRLVGIKKWFPVKDAADCYVNAYNAAKARRVETSAFIPMGLDADSFIDRQSDMSAHFISEMNKRILKADYDFRDTFGVETIVTGFDDTGPHIYIVRGDAVSCCDSVGFAAIGIGARHAESQFMINGHSPHSNREETLLLIYLAKKRSEVAPGVGEGTDMFISEGAGHLNLLDGIEDLDVGKIDSIYTALEKAMAKNFTSAQEKVKKYIASMIEARAQAAPKAEQQGQPSVRQIPGVPDIPEEPTLQS